jgi:hypothetical protein
MYVFQFDSDKQQETKSTAERAETARDPQQVVTQVKGRFEKLLTNSSASVALDSVLDTRNATQKYGGKTERTEILSFSS